MAADGGFQGTFRLPGLKEALDDLRRRADALAAGRLSDAQFKAYRVPMGVYEQREKGTFMLRCCFPGGVIPPRQMRTLAAVSRKYGNGVLHATTRQSMQIHGVPGKSICDALEELYEGGVSTKGTGGNTVRNITACPLAGVCPDEVFDVTPHALRLAERLLSDKLSFELPRKYKIALSGCGKDCAGAVVNDVGFIAKRRGEKPGFAVYAGGGMGSHSSTGRLLEEFVPVEEAPAVAESMKRVFDRQGNRRNRHQARLRFLVKKLGFERVRALYAQERRSLPADPSPPPESPAGPSRAIPPPAATRPEGMDRWQRWHVTAQKQESYFVARIPLLLGDIEAAKLDELADLVAAHGEGALRMTHSQNAQLRWVHAGELGRVYSELTRLGLTGLPPALADLTVCAGAATCQEGVCRSRGLAKAIVRELEARGFAPERLGSLRFNINGCPHACGRHPVAELGLFGGVRRVAGRLVPHYTVQLGGNLAEGTARLAEGAWTLPSRAAPAFVAEFLREYLDSELPSFGDFVRREGAAAAGRLVPRHSDVPPFEKDPSYYRDWDSEEEFSLAGRGPGECSAGVFDLIELDLAGATEALAAGRTLKAVTLASRALLVTRGEDPAGDREALRAFEELFIAQGLLGRNFERIIGRAIAAADPGSSNGDLRLDSTDAAAFLSAVKNLYAGMDSSLRFAPAPPGPADATHDFRTVACPLNYVKTKLALDRLPAGSTLLVLLNEEGARNVPPSVTNDGHEIVSAERQEDHWKVLIRKGAIPPPAPAPLPERGP